MSWRSVWLIACIGAGATGAAGAVVAGDPYFSEYVEGSGSNKALEIFNGTGASVSLAGWQVRFFLNGSTTPGATIALAGSLADGEVFVLAHAAADATILAAADQVAGGSWFNGDDAVALVKGGLPVDVIGQIGVDPGAAWGSGAASTADSTLRRAIGVAGGDADGSDAFVPAAEWVGLPSDTDSGLGAYPEPGLVPAALSVPQIQGAGHASPVAGALVETSGVVTAVESHGFYLQDAAGDGDAATSDGVFVYTSSAPAVVAGNGVKVCGQVVEFQPGGATSANLGITELHASDVLLLSASVTLPAPVILGVAGRPPPVQVIDDDVFALFDPRADGIDFLESLEGMRVLVDDPLAVSPVNAFGEFVTVADGGALATGLNARFSLTVSAGDFNPERLLVQLDGQLLPGFVPAVGTGDRLGDVVGVVSYAFGDYRVKATQPFAVSAAALPPEVAVSVPPDDHLSIASFNVLNLDPKVESLALVGGFADIDDDVGEGRFARLAEQIVAHLLSPDILALQEIQDSDGAEQTAVTDAGLTYATLIDAIAAAGGPAYEARDIAPGSGSSGGQPGGNIRVGFLFNPARVTLDEASLQALSDPELRDGDAFAFARRPLVARFLFEGRTVTLVNNHFSSKSGSTPLFGDVQPPVNGSVEQRIAQAQVVHGHVAELLARDPGARVVVLGDLNELAFLQPLAALKGGRTPDLVNLTELLPAAERYSYVFEGNAQAIDHVLVSEALAPHATLDVVHVNAEYADHASDHDPLLARIAFPAVCQPDLGFGSPGGATLSVCGDPLAPSGTARLSVSGLPAGATMLLLIGDGDGRGTSSTAAPGAAPHAAPGAALIARPLLWSLPLVADGSGVVSLPVAAEGAVVPLALVAQCLYRDVTLATPGLGLSNAVRLEFPGRQHPLSSGRPAARGW